MMKDSTDYRAWSLDEWLILATFGLVAPARARIKMEIEAHYADAVASRMADGMPQKEAEAAILLELGDPSAAAKSFRKQHLTETEDIWLRKWVNSSRTQVSSDRFWFSFFGELLIGGVLWQTSDHVQNIAHRIDLVLALGIYSAYVVTRMKFRRLLKLSHTGFDFSRKLLLLDLISQTTLMLFFFAASPEMLLNSFFSVGSFAYLSILALKRLSLRNKLRRAQSSDNGMLKV